MLLPESFDATSQVTPFVAEDGQGHAADFRLGFQLLANDLPIALVHWQNGQRFQVFQFQSLAARWQQTEPYSDDHQAPGLADLHRMVYQPEPIVRRGFGTLQLEQSYAQQPATARRRMRDFPLLIPVGKEQCQHSAGSRQRGSSHQHQTTKQPHHCQAIVLAFQWPIVWA